MYRNASIEKQFIKVQTFLKGMIENLPLPYPEAPINCNRNENHGSINERRDQRTLKTSINSTNTFTASFILYEGRQADRKKHYGGKFFVFILWGYNSISLNREMECTEMTLHSENSVKGTISIVIKS